MTAGRPTPSAPILLRDAITAWQDAAIAPLHRPGCSCCAGGGSLRLDSRWLAEDVDYALRSRYAAPGNERFAAVWNAARVPGDGDFVQRLAALGDAADGPAAERVMEDVIVMLRSIGAAR